jgi:threonine dehydrogenase-like Zn-dependent dehydrogenase
MKALCWFGKKNVRVETVPDPQILNPRDAIIRVTRTAICGSDLHLYDGYIPTLEQGDILGHEFMGEVVELGSTVKKLKVGDKVVVPFTICCGQCYFCKNNLWAACDNTNPNAWMLERMYGHNAAGLFGYSHLYGGYAGGQAQYVRVPMADVGPIKVPSGIPDEKVLFLSDSFPTGYQAAEYCNIKPGDVIAVWGCGPVGQFAIRSAHMLGAGHVIAIDPYPERLQLAAKANAEVLNYEEIPDIIEALKALTGGRGPDACIDAVGMEAHGHSLDAYMDEAKQKMKLTFDRAMILRQILQVCRKGGVVSIPGVYGGFLDKLPMGSAFAKGLTLRMGQTHMVNYMQPLLDRVQNGDIDPSEIISHRVALDKAPDMYEIFCNKAERCTKVVLDPWATAAAA